MMRFIGVDLARGMRNPSGVAAIEGFATHGELIATDLLHTDDEIVAWVTEHAGESAIVAIDAPLRVPNEAGRRPAEAEISRAFARYHAGAHPANRRRLTIDGVVRGESLVTQFESHGFTHRPDVTAGELTRQIVEVYTHPAIIAFFDLPAIVRYKARPNRTRPQRLMEFGRLQSLLLSLTHGDPALHGADTILTHDLTTLTNARLKDYEDQLDAIVCAYTAHYLWRWGMARARVFGSFEKGYITTPVPPAMWTQARGTE
jgi:predicted RNase H-like nuclease